MVSPFGELLTAARAAHEPPLSRGELRELLDAIGVPVSDAAIDHWESGRRAPKAEHFRALCAVLDWDEPMRRRAQDLVMGFPSEAS